MNDSSTDGSGEVAREFPVRVLDLVGGPFGPAYARNRGAEIAHGDILFFVDADVVLHPATLERVRTIFTERFDVDATFGSYDDRPGATDFLSRYRNLLHHYIHQEARSDAGTFWGACGAIRRSVFIDAGGFEETRYRRPSIEDIDLGYRLKARGHRILLDKNLQVQHLKRWTLRSMIKTDVFDRAIPWTRLMLQSGGIPNDLNLRLPHRLSAILLVATVPYLGATQVMGWSNFRFTIVAPLVLVTTLILLMNYGLYAFFMRKQGLAFMLAAIPCHVLYYLYSGVAFALGVGLHLWQSFRMRWA